MYGWYGVAQDDRKLCYEDKSKRHAVAVRGNAFLGI
jgi:hypothetical protein